MRFKISPGDLVLWHSGETAIIVKQVDIYLHAKIASRRGGSQMRWLLEFTNDTPSDYIEDWGMTDEMLLSGHWCRIIHQKK